MRRILTIMLLAAILLDACTTAVPSATPNIQPTKTPPPASTALPTATKMPDLGARPDELKGQEVLVWHGWNGAAADLFARMGDEFNASNQWGIKVKLAAWPNLNSLEAEVDKTLDAASDRPDIIVAMPEQILAWQENVLDLSPYLAQAEFGIDPGDVSGAFWDQSNLNGVRYGVPAARSARFLFYNLSFARDLGFNAAPLTTEDFRKQACAANALWKQDADLTNDGFGGLALDVASNWQTPYSWLAVAGGQVFADGKFQFNTPENISALEFISTLRADGCAWQSTSISNFEHFASRKALFITGNLSDIAEQQLALSAAASADQWTVLPFPGEKPGIVAYGPDYAVLKTSGPRQLAAWLFIRWMLEEKNQVHWSRGSGLMPVTAAAVKTLEADPSSIPQWVAALRLIPQALPYPQTAGWRIADKILADGFMAYSAGFPAAKLENVFKTIDATIAELTK